MAENNDLNEAREAAEQAHKRLLVTGAELQRVNEAMGNDKAPKGAGTPREAKDTEKNAGSINFSGSIVTPSRDSSAESHAEYITTAQSIIDFVNERAGTRLRIVDENALEEARRTAKALEQDAKRRHWIKRTNQWIHDFPEGVSYHIGELRERKAEGQQYQSAAWLSDVFNQHEVVSGRTGEYIHLDKNLRCALAHIYEAMYPDVRGMFRHKDDDPYLRLLGIEEAS